PGHTRMDVLELFPGSEKAKARFPDFDETNAIFSNAGLRLVQDQVVEEGSETYAQRANFSERMRHADSILTALSDQEVEAGIAALRAEPNRVVPFALSLLVYEAT
ncbi:MAG: hypothetical protein ABWY80_08825, partial [Acidimicrobiia bacterium]